MKNKLKEILVLGANILAMTIVVVIAIIKTI
jgi:hypothetical protein